MFIDKKFNNIGFNKIVENRHNVRYERYDEKFKYTHVLSINHKYDGDTIVQSYNKELFDERKIGNCCVGLTEYEMKLVLKKIKSWERKFWL